VGGRANAGEGEDEGGGTPTLPVVCVWGVWGVCMCLSGLYVVCMCGGRGC